MKSSDIFQCKRCGQCCKGYGGTYLRPEDVDAISAYIGESSSAFVSRYCQRSGGRLMLGQGEDGYCIFYKEACTVHPVKPKMCKAWPFIESVLIDVRNWGVMAETCPGMRSDVPDDVIKNIVAGELAEK